MSPKLNSKSWIGSKTLEKLIKNPKLHQNQVQNTSLDSVSGYKPKQSPKVSLKSRSESKIGLKSTKLSENQNLSFKMQLEIPIYWIFGSKSSSEFQHGLGNCL